MTAHEKSKKVRANHKIVMFKCFPILIDVCVVDALSNGNFKDQVIQMCLVDDGDAQPLWEPIAGHVSI
ncbi:hypothetical protein MKW98_014697 [Papaver atlanticum]|uniref:Uncharacterized protein n=1 Tax=Papaver atlanticum TaxID=357466 RepID=A0AAD4XCV0_9MAGN|nr:hypothetical protein MKW98_014697 [Papaver atlanticum]